MSTNTNITIQNQTSPAPEQTFYSTSSPVATTGYAAGDTLYVTPLGIQADSANATEMWRFDGTKWVKVPIGIPAPTGQNVYFDSTDPASGTIFDVENPPITNNDFLKQDSSNTYYGTDGSVWTWNGTAYITKVYNFTTQKRNEFTATAGQTSFTLTSAPIGQLYGYRNGVKLPTSFTWVGSSVTYVPSNNGGKTIDAGDVISFEYSAY
jgi:hypothetical protein